MHTFTPLACNPKRSSVFVPAWQDMSETPLSLIKRTSTNYSALYLAGGIRKNGKGREADYGPGYFATGKLHLRSGRQQFDMVENGTTGDERRIVLMV
jgi:hypothetical protein